MICEYNKMLSRVCLAALFMMAGFAQGGVCAAGQESNSSVHGKGTDNKVPKKEIKFEVVSIHPVKSGWSPYDRAPAPLLNITPSPDGFRSTLTLSHMLMIAYAPDDQSWGTTPVIKWPPWPAEWYVINARVSDADVDAWRNQSGHHELLRSAMRDLLKQRCKLALHLEPAELPDYKLVIGKNGLKMKATGLGSAPPKGAITLPTGAARMAEGAKDRPTWRYYNATVGDLVEFLNPAGTGSPRPPLHDETGLTGRYNFALTMVEAPSRDPHESIYNFPVGHLGLEVKASKYRGFRLIIDHIEKPSAN